MLIRMIQPALEIRKETLSTQIRRFFTRLHSVSPFFTLCLLVFATGSDLPKQEEQLGAGIVNEFPLNFSQNGLVAYKNGEILEVQTIAKFLGEDNVKRLVNWVLDYLSRLDIPVKV